MIHLLTMVAGNAADVTVSPGDDIGSVTSSLGAGDTITFEAGTYELEGTVTWTGVGTEDEPIQFLGADGAEVVLRGLGGWYIANVEDSDWIVLRNLVIEGGDEAEYNGTAGIRVSNSSNIRIEDCTVRNVWSTAMRIDGDTTAITLQHNEIAGTGDGSGIYAGCGDGACWMSDSTIVNNLIHDIQGTGINLQRGTQGVTISDNVLFRIRDDGLVLPDTQFGPQNRAIGNAIWQTEDDGIYVWGSALVQNNIVFETGDDGLYSRDDGYGSLFDVQISHNTISRTDGYAAELDDWYYAEDMVFANNALSNPTGYGLDYYDPRSDSDYYGYDVDDTDNYIRNNVVTGLVQGFDLLVRPDFVIPGGGVGDFVDADNFDFYPTRSSVLLDSAESDGNAYIPALDFNGVPRNGASPDVGAYEYSGEINPGWTLAEGFKLTGAAAGVGPGINTGCCGANESGGTQAILFAPVLALGLGLRRRRIRG